MFRWTDIRLLYIREMRSALRERNIVINSILLPIFLYPLLLWIAYSAVSFVSGQTEGFTSRIHLAAVPPEHGELAKDLESRERFILVKAPDPLAAIRKGELDLLLEFVPALKPAPAPGANLAILLTFDKSRDRSALALERVSEELKSYRSRFLEREAAKLGLRPEEFLQFQVSQKNASSSRRMGQFLLSRILPVFLLIMLCVGCMYPAIDCTAGEREKSTWETLMTVASPRSNIVAAKYLYMATLAVAAGILNLTAMVLSMKTIMAPLLGNRGEDFTFRIPLESLPLILLLTVLLALLIAAGMMILAAFAQNFKEGQAMVSPFYVAVLLPMMFVHDPSLEFTATMALIPVVNVIFVFRDAVYGLYDWPLIAIVLAVEVLCIGLALRLAAAILKYEDFLMGSYNGSAAKFIWRRMIGAKWNRRSVQ